jgi:hypothetical protein
VKGPNAQARVVGLVVSGKKGSERNSCRPYKGREGLAAAAYRNLCAIFAAIHLEQVRG